MPEQHRAQLRIGSRAPVCLVLVKCDKRAIPEPPDEASAASSGAGGGARLKATSGLSAHPNQWQEHTATSIAPDGPRSVRPITSGTEPLIPPRSAATCALSVDQAQALKVI